MDEHMAALALTSLSCSPASPIMQSAFANFQRMLLTFYSVAALLAMQSAVLATAIPSIRLSVCLSHAGIVPRPMKIGS